MESGILPFTCDQSECPAYASCSLVPTQVKVGKGSPEEVILFVGDSPGLEDAAECVPFTIGDASGGMFRKTLRTLNTRGVSIAYSNLVRHRFIDDHGEAEKPAPEAAKACLKHLQADIERLKPIKIVVLGEALRLLIPEAPPLIKARGQHFNSELGRVLATYHPAYVRKKQNRFGQWQTDLQLALGSREQQKKNDRWCAPYTCNLLEKIQDVEDYVDHLLTDKIKIVACDTETKNLNKRYGNVLGTFQFSEDGKQGTVIPYNHPENPWWPDDMVRLNAALTRLFTSPDPKFRYWVFHNVGFDFRMILNFSLGIVKFNRPLMDTGMMAYAQDENRGKSGIDRPYSLNSLLRDYLKVEKYEDPEIERMIKQGRALEIELKRLAQYGASDAVHTWRLFWFILERAKRENYDKKLLKLVEHWFEPVNRMNAIMGSNGFWVDMDQLRELRNERTSPIARRMVEIQEGWKDRPACKKTNQRLLHAKLGGKMTPTFGGGDGAWMFDIDKRDHKLALFFDVMGLEPLDYGKVVRTPILSPKELKAGKIAKETPCGKLDKAFQERYGDVHEVEMLHEHSGLKKLKTSYVKSIYEFLDPRNGHEGSQDNRVRPSFWVTTTDTGRSSCTDPNLQQVPRADNWAKKEIKNMYAAEPGTALIQLDFMTSEVRWWGILAGCPSLAEAFAKGKQARDRYLAKSKAYCQEHPKLRYRVLEAGADMLNPEDEMSDGRFNFKPQKGEKGSLQSLRGKYPTKSLKVAWKRLHTDEDFRDLCQAKVYAGIAGDVHKSTASQMYKVPITQVTKGQRTDTKSIVFGSMFGRGPKAIAQQLKISDIDEVINRISDFFAQFPDAEKWMTTAEEDGERDGFVESPIGRRRRLMTFQMKLEDEGEKARAKRIARNAPIQGISSDGAFLGGAMFCDWLIDNDKWHVHPTKACWLLQDVVHDSLVLQVPIDDVPEALEAVRPWFTEKLMERMTDVWGVKFNIPLEVDFEFGLKWGDMESWDGTQLHLDFLMKRLRKAEVERAQEAA